jgi:superfamily II DNA/RNA helicase
VLGGEQYTNQKKALSRVVDIVVASPGRLMQHKEQGNVFLSQVDSVIIDEVDTMLTQGFGSDIRGILRSVIANKATQEKKQELAIASAELSGVPVDASAANEQSHPSIHLTMATATLTKAVKALLDDVASTGGSGGDGAKPKAGGAFNVEYSDPTNKTPRKMDGSENRIKMRYVFMHIWCRRSE